MHYIKFILYWEIYYDHEYVILHYIIHIDWIHMDKRLSSRYDNVKGIWLKFMRTNILWVQKQALRLGSFSWESVMKGERMQQCFMTATACSMCHPSIGEGSIAQPYSGQDSPRTCSRIIEMTRTALSSDYVN